MQAARKLFTQKGFAAIRTRDIAKEAGINLALLNYYFRSKEKLFDIVMMDNFQAHKVSGVQEAIERARATVRYLPKYSPDLNPIEMSYSKFKTLMRKVAARTVPALNRAIRSFIPQLSPQECANYFSHAGYASI